MTKSIKFKTSLPSLINPNTNQLIKSGDTVPLWALNNKGQWVQKNTAVVTSSNGSLMVESDASDGLSLYNWNYIGLTDNNFPSSTLVSFNSSFSQSALDTMLQRTVSRSGNGLGNQVSLISPEMYSVLKNYKAKKISYVEDNESVPPNGLGYNVIFEVRNNDGNSNHPLLTQSETGGFVKDLGTGVVSDEYEIDKFIQNFVDFRINDIAPGLNIIIKFKLKRAGAPDLISQVSFSTAKLASGGTVLLPSPPINFTSTTITTRSTSAFVDAGNTATNYRWSAFGPDDVLFTPNTNPSSTDISFKKSGFYTIQVVVSYSNKNDTISQKTIEVKQNMSDIFIMTTSVLINKYTQVFEAYAVDQFGHNMSLAGIPVEWNVTSQDGTLPLSISGPVTGPSIQSVNNTFKALDETSTSDTMTTILTSDTPTSIAVMTYDTPLSDDVTMLTTSVSAPKTSGSTEIITSSVPADVVFSTDSGVGCVIMDALKPYILGFKLESDWLSKLPTTFVAHIPKLLSIGGRKFAYQEPAPGSAITSHVWEDKGVTAPGAPKSSITIQNINGETKMTVDMLATETAEAATFSVNLLFRYRADLAYKDYIVNATSLAAVTRGMDGVWRYNHPTHPIYDTEGNVVPGPTIN